MKRSAVQMYKDGFYLFRRAVFHGLTGQDGRGDQAGTASHEMQEDTCDAFQHAASGHGPAETHGANDQPNRVHHPGHSPGRD